MSEEQEQPGFSLNHSEYQSQVYKAMLYAAEPERLILIDDTLAYFNGDHRLHQLARCGDTWTCDCAHTGKPWPCKHIIAAEKILRCKTDRLWNGNCSAYCGMNTGIVTLSAAKGLVFTLTRFFVAKSAPQNDRLSSYVERLLASDYSGSPAEPLARSGRGQYVSFSGGNVMIELLLAMDGILGLIVLGGLFIAVEYWMLTLGQ